MDYPMKKPASASKSKMQMVSFDSIDEFLEFLPADQLELTQYLRKMVFDCVPDVEERLSFNVPYYFGNAGMFFIWPGAVGWGKKTYAGVRFGFQSGYLMQDEIGYLDRGTRKQIFWKDFLSLAEIDNDILRAYIFEAVEIDAQKAKRKRKTSVDRRQEGF
jgi:hypothetical protein